MYQKSRNCCTQASSGWKCQQKIPRLPILLANSNSSRERTIWATASMIVIVVSQSSHTLSFLLSPARMCISRSVGHPSLTWGFPQRLPLRPPSSVGGRDVVHKHHHAVRLVQPAWSCLASFVRPSRSGFSYAYQKQFILMYIYTHIYIYLCIYIHIYMYNRYAASQCRQCQRQCTHPGRTSSWVSSSQRMVHHLAHL